MIRSNPSDETCMLCGSKTISRFSAGPLDYCLDKSFSINQCLGCGLGKTKEVKSEDLNMVYEDGAYDPKENLSHKLLRPMLNFVESFKLAYLHQTQEKEGALLEIGTGKGNFLKIALDSGYDAVGIEPSTRSYNIAKAKLGDRVFHCTLEQVTNNSQLNKEYDHIFLWHVFEHLNDPEGAVSIMKALLKPTGTLIIAIPNFSSNQARIGGKNWYHLDPPRHLSHFTPESIKLLLDRNGLRIKCIYFDSFFQNFLGEIITIGNLVLPHKNILLNFLRRNKFYFIKKSLRSRILNLIAFILLTSILIIPVLLLTWANQAMGKSGTMIVVSEGKTK
ncbi:MAG: class I SAM-dependent methyltransferase [Cyclobacteriaceae bacterium]|nr:class I SAM-dependent methyltransferase [Cyclobacteriaceae bacterium]